MDFPKKSCPNISTPCWIPQAASIIPRDLPQCDSIQKYSCMMVTLYAARAIVNEQCLKPCGAESYKIESSRNTLEPFVKVSCSLG